MNKCIFALSTALTIFTAAPAFAQNNQVPATVDCTLPANANDPACMKNGTGATGGVSGQNDASGTMSTTSGSSTQTMSSGNIIVPADQLNNAHVMSANDYIGKTVYDQNGNNIGEVNDIVISEDGKINAVILGVGGFLGIGEKDVAVSMNSIKVMNDNANAGTVDNTTNGTTGTAADTTGSTTAADDTNADGMANLSNRRLVVETTKEALNAAPAYDRANRRYVPSSQ